ncbi:MAG: hypothetical protein H6737_31155 [Alphaproteobacteria bacterium]|nr:hypothetical protein [Alphaproteobacteria bacterium]
MRHVIAGPLPHSAGECLVWAEGSVLARAPVLQERFEVELEDPPHRVAVEHRVDDEVRRACIAELDGERTDLSEMTPGSTLRAQAWRAACERGLGDRIHLVEALLPDPIGDAVRRMPRALRFQARDQLLKALRVAMHAQRFDWRWDELEPALAEKLAAPVRTFVVTGLWRSALRVSAVDRPLVELCEPAAAAFEQRACRLAARLLSDALAPVGVSVPDPADHRGSGWSIAMLLALRPRASDPEREGQLMTAASVCTEIAVAMDRALDGMVASALERDDPAVLQGTLAHQLRALEGSLHEELGAAAPHVPGSWTGLAALWVTSLVGLGFSEDIDRSTERYTFPSYE